jgi:hypothetical protein
MDSYRRHHLLVVMVLFWHIGVVVCQVVYQVAQEGIDLQRERLLRVYQNNAPRVVQFRMLMTC